MNLTTHSNENDSFPDTEEMDCYSRSVFPLKRWFHVKDASTRTNIFFEYFTVDPLLRDQLLFSDQLFKVPKRVFVLIYATWQFPEWSLYRRLIYCTDSVGALLTCRLSMIGVITESWWRDPSVIVITNLGTSDLEPPCSVNKMLSAIFRAVSGQVLPLMLDIFC